MKIVFTGGVTGGHFYPIIAVAEAVREISRQKKLVEPFLYFIAPGPYNEKILFDNKIIFRQVPSGKMRVYFSLLNFFDKIFLLYGMLKALWIMFWIYPDVVFSKGGSGSIPVVWSAKILGIPIIIHESDCVPGRANLWAAKKAQKISISYPEAAEFLPKEKTAWTGNPIRKSIRIPTTEGAMEYLDLEQSVQTILILGGSQGAQIINDAIMTALPELVKKYQIIHQVGKNNITDITETSKIILENSQFSHRYRSFAYLDDLAMKMAAGATDLIISRAGSTIFEIANWGRPSILIPITKSNGNHQRKNAYIYARTGAATVIEEANLSDTIILAEIERILGDKMTREKMSVAAKSFAKPEAAETIARQIIGLGLSH